MKLKGQIQVYTGHGKGKTTAALGLCLRARGRGLKTAIIFFDKGGWHYGERESLAILGIDFWVTGKERFNEKTRRFRFGVNDGDRDEGMHGIDIARQLLKEKEYDLLVLDEINSTVALEIVSLEAVLSLIDKRSANTELVLTGRDVPSAILERANLVTEMRPIKHYYYEGIDARAGIEY
ncbi:MAG: cob(I)yrinic acid a,c-diamide adenosyltransferase [Candidatus Komeilibacteria bacterium]|nr:cob(I)yrinic acid a,c-diamide adenosyltransferase [Candidatus Komeilibacteria bacterium]